MDPASSAQANTPTVARQQADALFDTGLFGKEYLPSISPEDLEEPEVLMRTGMLEPYKVWG